MRKRTYLRKIILCCLLVLLVFATSCKSDKAEDQLLGSWDFNQGAGAFYPQAYTSQLSNFAWDKDGGIDLQFFSFLLRGGLALGKLLGLLCVAELFLVGCAHVIISSHICM